MSQESERVLERLNALEVSLEDLRNTLKVTTKSYSDALTTLADLTFHASEAAKRAANSTVQSRIASMNALLAVKQASLSPELISIVEIAATATMAAALAAVESAAAAASAAAVAATAVVNQAEESLLKASADAAIASRLAAVSAAEAVKLSNQAKDILDNIRKQK